MLCKVIISAYYSNSHKLRRNGELPLATLGLEELQLVAQLRSQNSNLPQT